MSATARIIDANFNRAREALRTMEDVARFALDDAALTERAKSLRHGLAEALAGAGVSRAELLAARDTPGDVGMEIKGAGEGVRPGMREVAAAAGGRLTEALRSIEEALKVEGRGAGAAEVERIRYQAYELDRVLGLALGGAGGRAPQWRLCVLITEALCCGGRWEWVAQRAVEGGADCLQLREKGLSDRELLARAKKLVEVARSTRTNREDAIGGTKSGGTKVSVIINDRADVALASGADGVHLGQTDLPIDEARRVGGGKLLIGVSTENTDQARGAVLSGADYCGVGPMFATETKAKPVIRGAAYLREYLADPVLAACPHLAIGGITPGSIGELVAAGCRGVAVSSAVCGAEDPAGVCREIRTAIPPAGASRTDPGAPGSVARVANGARR